MHISLLLLLLFFDFAVCVTQTLSPNTFPSLSQAVASASSGSVLQLGPGVYAGSQNCAIFISNTNLTLVGAQGPQNTIIDCANISSRCIWIDGGSNVNIRGIQFRNGNAPNLITRTINPQHSPKQPKLNSETEAIFKRWLPARRGQERVIFTVHVVLTMQGTFHKKTVVIQQKRTRKSISKNNPKVIRSNTNNIDLSNAGGCLLVTNSKIVLENVVIFGGRALIGGGIAVVNSSIAIAESAITQNGMNSNSNADASGGGGYFVNSLVSIENSTVNNNFLSWSGIGWLRGGGMYFILCDNAVLINTTISNNVIKASYGISSMLAGGGMCWEHSKNIQLVSLSIVGNSMLVENTTSYGYAKCVDWVNTNFCGTSLIGAGSFFGSCSNILLTSTGQFAVSNNIVNATKFESVSNGILLCGGGLAFVVCNTVLLMGGIGNIEIHHNSLTAVNSTGSNSGISLFGGGLYWQLSTDIIMSGRVSISDNSIVSINSVGINAVIALYGAGQSVLFCNRVRMEGQHAVLRNSMVSIHSTGGDKQFWVVGGGILFLSSTYVTMINTTISENSINIPSSACDTAPYTQGAGMLFSITPFVRMDGILVSNNSLSVTSTCTKQYSQRVTRQFGDDSTCPAYISDLDGTLYGNFSILSSCQWTIKSPSSSFTLRSVFKLQLNSVNTYSDDPTCSVASLSFYDGSSSLSPLIGSYCSYGSPSVTIHCSRGLCPNATDIIGSSGATTVQMIRNYQSVSFELSWSIAARDMNQSFPVSNSTAGLLDIPSISGAGMSLYGCDDIHLTNSAVVFNRINYTFLAFGGGISISSGSTMAVVNSTVSNNVVIGSVASAAGIGAFQSSTIVVLQSNISNNVALGQGICFWTNGAIQCPTSFGGGLAVAFSAVVELYNVTVSNNMVECDTVIGHPCIGRGGGAGVTANGTLQTHKSRLRQNTCYCRHDAGCAMCLGGGVYGDDGVVDHSDSSILSQNAVDGLGTGGGACLQGTVVSNMDNATIEYNTAFEGGGIWITDMATMTMAGCTLHNNTAGTVGGAMVASSSCIIDIHNTNMIDNHAPYAATIAGYFSINNIAMTIANSSIAGSTTNHIAVIGASNISVSYLCTENNTVWNAAFPNNGTGFASLSFIGCSQGSYSIGPASSSSAEKTECYACPLEANCDGDAIGVYARSGFWGMASSDSKVLMYACPDGYCCENETCIYDYCGGHRQGLLCGSCEDSFSAALFSSQCVENARCYHGYWAAPLLFCVSIIAIIGYAMYATPASGIFSIPIFFYQATPLTSSLGNQGSISGVLSVVHSVFGLSIQGSRSSGLCLFPNVTAASKLWIEMGAYLVIFVAIFPAMAIHKIVWSRFNKFEEPTMSRYIAIAVKIGEISYITWAVNTLKMQQCIQVGSNKWRWFFNAEDNGCLDEPWQIVGLLLCLILGTIPFLISALAIKWSTNSSLSKHEDQICQVLVSPYKPERWWWCGISLGRRFLISIAFAFTTSSNRRWRPAAMMILCVLILALNIWLRPFKTEVVQRLEMVSLLIMSLLTALSIPGLMLEQFGLQESEKQGLVVQVVQLLLFLVPGVAVTVTFVRNKIAESKIGLFKSKRETLELSTLGRGGD